MTDDELQELLAELEAGLLADVEAALALTAQDFSEALDGATELVAARFSVSGIGGMWRRRVSGIMARLSAITRKSAEVAAEELGEELPEGWDADLTEQVSATETLLNAVGDRLAAAATQSLAEGMNAGEDLETLRARLAAVFVEDGSELGASRASRIATTEATRAWNQGALAAAQALAAEGNVVVKQWLTSNDERVRPSHRDANGQLRMLEEPFDVDGTAMMYPGDPAAPAVETIMCRCILKATAAPVERDDVNEEPQVAAGELSAAADVHTGAMIALMPSEGDAQRLALEGGEAVDQLHLTLFYLGEAADWSDVQQADLTARVAVAAASLAPVPGRVFGAAQWNPASDEPAWVWNVGDDMDGDGSRLNDVKFEVTWALEDGHGDPDIPRQYSPWAPHICAVYGGEGRTAELADRVGPVTFDRIRVAFAGRNTDFPLTGSPVEPQGGPAPVETSDGPPEFVTWSTPDPTALAFENQQTGDGRVFAPGALYWSDGPWPLQYADQMNGGHDGARLAGAIFGMGRDGDALRANGVLYLTQSAGAESAMLLSQGAPLGVSVDLDDVSVELLDATGGETYSASLVAASLLPLPDGGWHLVGETAAEWTASGTGTVGESSRVDIVTGPDGTVPASAFQITAAAGDPGDGVVVDRQDAGSYLMRIVRARVRGATLVAVPAFAEARVVLDDASVFASAGEELSASSTTPPYERVVRHVRKALIPVTAGEAAKFLRIPVADVRRYLARASKKGTLVRIAHGRYVRPTEATAQQAGEAATTAATGVADLPLQLTASATGAVDLPVAPRDTAWDGPGAESRVFEWAGGDADRIGKAFAYRNDDADPLTKAAYKLGYADVADGTLTIIPRGVFAAQAAMEGARGGVDIPADEVDDVKAKLMAVRAHVDEETGEAGADDMAASAWSAMRDLPPMPAKWFTEPTAEELPPGGAGVNYNNGRIFGWVAQAGEPHAGFAKKITIDTLGRIDTTHFLRQKFTLDDGEVVKAGAFTMNVGHHRDGAECETSSCQFDDTRTVAGIVTVGMNARGMWFSGAAAPWLSEWDRSVFAASQPSYHMRKGGNGQWQLRAVLSVPVPGHSSPLLASAVVDRSNMALTAAATMAEVEDAVASAAPAEVTSVPDVAAIDYDRLADSMVAAMARAEDRKAAEDAELEALLSEARKIGADTGTSEGN